MTKFICNIMRTKWVFLVLFIKIHFAFIFILLWHQIYLTVTIITKRVKNTESSMMRVEKVLKLIFGGPEQGTLTVSVMAEFIYKIVITKWPFFSFNHQNHIAFIFILLWHQIHLTVTIITKRVKNTESLMMRGRKVLKLIFGDLNNEPLQFQWWYHFYIK